MTQAREKEHVLQYDEIDIGQAAQPISIDVTRQTIANYARSIQEHDPIFTDAEVARSAGYPGIIAPASMHMVYAPARRVDIMHEHGAIAPEEASVNPRSTPFVGMEIQWHGILVQAGDVITSVARFAKKWEARSGNKFVGIGVTAHNQRGEKVVDYQYNVMWEFAKSQKSRAPDAKSATQPAAPVPTTGNVLDPSNLVFDAIQVGDALPSTQWDITQELIDNYAVFNKRAGESPNPTMLLHVDEAFARNTVFAGTTLQGPAAVGHLILVLTKGFGVRNIINQGAFSERALEPVRPGDTITYTGGVLDKRVEEGKRIMVVEVTGTNQLGQTTAASQATLLL
jgi:acyl dehydratase